MIEALIYFFTTFLVIWIIGAIIWFILCLIPGKAGLFIRIPLLIIAAVFGFIAGGIMRNDSSFFNKQNFAWPWWSILIWLVCFAICLLLDVGSSLMVDYDEARGFFLSSIPKGLLIYGFVTLSATMVAIYISWNNVYVEFSSQVSISLIT